MKCERHPNVELHDLCMFCGAPQCCRVCCNEATNELRPEMERSAMKHGFPALLAILRPAKAAAPAAEGEQP